MSAPAHLTDRSGDRVSLERFVTALTRADVWHRLRGDHIDFRCPLPDHADTSASCTADWCPPDGRRPGQVKFECKACGPERGGEMLAALGLSWGDKYDDAPTRPDPSSPRAVRGPSRQAPARSTAPRSSPPASASLVGKSTAPRKGPTASTWREFPDAAGVCWFLLDRQDPIGPDAEQRSKVFYWWHAGGARGGRVKGKRCDPAKVTPCPACRDGRTPDMIPLYRLPAVLAAVAAGERVWVTEGGKNADDLAAVVPAGEVTTTAPNGATARWEREYTAALAGAAVTVVADRDAGGYAHAATVAAELRAAGCPVRVVRTPLDVEKADSSDHVAAGLTLEEFEDVPPALLGEQPVRSALTAPAPAPSEVDESQDDEHDRGDDGDGQAGAEVRELYPQRRRGGGGRPRPERKRTDYGNAERLIDAHGDDLLNLRSSWYVWDGTRYRRDETGAVERRAKATVRTIYGEAARVSGDSDAAAAERKAIARHAAKSEALNSIRAMVALASTEAAVVVDGADDLDADPWLLNCRNGTVDLRTGELRAHDRADRITRSTGVEFDPAAPAPTWDAFLARVQPDPGAREFLQRIIGYSLTGLTSEEKLFLLNGGGQNGKSTCIAMIMAALGEYAMAAPPDLLIAKRPGTIPNDVAALRGARLASATETEEGARLNESRTKELVTGDIQSARYLHKDFFTFRPVAKYWISTNHRPVIRGADDAIWRRMVLVPFDQQIRADEKDPHLAEKLRAELPGILAWAVRGCLAWQRDGLEPPSTIRAATAAYRDEQDLIGTFLDDCCVEHPAAHTPASALYGEYKRWCEAAGENPQSQRRFGQRLGERGGFTKDKTGHANTVTWFGVGLRLGGNWDHLVDDDPPPAADPTGPPPTADPADPAPSSPRAEDPATAAAEPDQPCPSCATPGPSCGLGSIADDPQPCVICGESTRVRARCGTPRHGNCGPRDDEGPTAPSPGPTPTPAPGAESHAEPARGPGRAEGAVDAPRGAQRRSERPRRGLHLYGVLDHDALTVVADRRAGPTEPLDEYPRDVAGCPDLARRHGLEMLWVHDSALARLGVPTEGDEPPPGVEPWWVVDRGEAGQVTVALPAWLDGVWIEAESGRELAEALARFEGAVGMRPVTAPAATAAALLGMLHNRTGARPLVAPDWLPDREVTYGERPLMWARPLTDEETRASWVIGLDKRAAYPSVMRDLRLGMGTPIHHPDGAWNPKVPGRHRIADVEPTPDRDPRLPDPLTGAVSGWRCTETLLYAEQAGARFRVVESYTWPDSSRPLATFSERIRGGIATLREQRAGDEPGAALALDALKDTYASIGGNLASHFREAMDNPGKLFRPDWTGTIVAKARVNILRNLDKIEARPFAGNVDELFFAVTDPDPAAVGLPIGTKNGQYGLKTSPVALAEVADAIRRCTEGRLNPAPAPLLHRLAELDRGEH